MRNAEVSNAKVVPGEQFAPYAETTDLFLIRAGRVSPCTEELGRLVFLKGMGFVVRAYCAVPPADLPVLFGIFRNTSGRVNHNE